MTPALPAPGLRHVCDLHVLLGPIMELGAGRAGQRRIIPIVGGRVTGPDITGDVLDLGADWQTVWNNGVAELDTRYAIRTHDDAVIEVINYGYRHGPPNVIKALSEGEDVPHDRYYMRTHARLETGDPRYDWVNSALFVGRGQRRAADVVLSLFRID